MRGRLAGVALRHRRETPRTKSADHRGEATKPTSGVATGGKGRTSIVALTEPCELTLHAGEPDVVGAHRDRQLEPRLLAHPYRVLRDRLGRVRGEPARPLEAPARLTPGGQRVPTCAAAAPPLAPRPRGARG